MSEQVNDYRSVRRESVELHSIPPFGTIAPDSTVFSKLLFALVPSSLDLSF